ncbi:polyglutamine-binding protein 1-like [Rhopilema esculentum]|uniref:polyglutamine-binding protein 1-like n=1 Tax=Rhopilema esculentum TaxID=499914 RepID=UPI0031CE3509|eukprot:gene2328-17963_t
MPLPTALQARLQRRGLLKHEEIAKEKDEATKLGCPNAWNEFHTCVAYCRERWGERLQQSDKKGSKSHNTKPLPPGWFLVPDPKSGHSYYWNVHTNMVSWVHPQDPKANITLPVSLQQSKDNEASQQPPGVPREDEATVDHASNEIKSDESKKIPPKIKTGKHPSLLKAQRNKDRANPYKRKQNEKDDLDPMDPSAYSDVPRGTWNSGLRDDRDVKTGVDTTANGPLFQQRPYPSPGEVLRRNRQHQQPAD